MHNLDKTIDIPSSEISLDIIKANISKGFQDTHTSKYNILNFKDGRKLIVFCKYTYKRDLNNKHILIIATSYVRAVLIERIETKNGQTIAYFNQYIEENGKGVTSKISPYMLQIKL